jgi:hypothetical protein
MWLFLIFLYLFLGASGVTLMYYRSKAHLQPIYLSDLLWAPLLALFWPFILIAFLFEESDKIIIWNPKPPQDPKP